MFPGGSVCEETQSLSQISQCHRSAKLGVRERGGDKCYKEENIQTAIIIFFRLSANKSVQSAIFLEGFHSALETEVNIKTCPLKCSTFGMKEWYPVETIPKTNAKVAQIQVRMQTHLKLGLLQNWCISGSPEKNHNCRPKKQDIDVSLSSAVHFPHTRASQFKSTSQYPGCHANTNSTNTTNI